MKKPKRKLINGDIITTMFDRIAHSIIYRLWPLLIEQLRMEKSHPKRGTNLGGRSLALPIQSLILGMRQVEKLAERKMWTAGPGREPTKKYDEEIITIVYSLKIDIDRAMGLIEAYFSKARGQYTHA